jgi:putative nucleotidyltransferase with HDIG domain
LIGRFRRRLGEIIAQHARSAAEQEDLRHWPPVVRGGLIIGCMGSAYACTKVAPADVPAVSGLTLVYALTMLVPPITSPWGQIRLPRLAFCATIAMLWSPLHTLVGITAGTLLGVLAFRLYEPWRAMMNCVLWAYPTALASLAGHEALGRITDPLLGLTAAGLTIVIVYWATNYAAIALWRRLANGEPFFRYWWRSVSEDPLGQMLSAPLPIFLGAIGHGLGSPPAVLVILTGLSALMMPTERAQRTLYFASQRTTTDIVRALMLALERLNPGARAHAERVSELVAAAGRALGMRAHTVEVWRHAGLLHDVGLIDADSRAGPPGMHAVVGAKILASHPDPMVADIVREHHKPWFRGSSRMERSALLGARALAAAEAYDELRYGHSGSRGLGTHAATAAALRPLIGTQLDPVVTAVVLETAERQERRRAS